MFGRGSERGCQSEINARSEISGKKIVSSGSGGLRVLSKKITLRPILFVRQSHQRSLVTFVKLVCAKGLDMRLGLKSVFGDLLTVLLDQGSGSLRYRLTSY